MSPFASIFETNLAIILDELFMTLSGILQYAYCSNNLRSFQSTKMKQSCFGETNPETAVPYHKRVNAL